MRISCVLVAISVAACGGKQAPDPQPAPTVGNEATTPEAAPVATVSKRSVPDCGTEDGCDLRVMQYFRDEMCGCASRADQACAQGITDEMAVWAQEAAKRADADRRWTASEAEEMEEVGKQLGECTGRAMMPEATDATSSAPPPAGQPTGRQLPVGPPAGPKPGCASGQQVSDVACAIDLMTWYGDAMCACTTKQCATDLTNDMTRWAQQMSKTQAPTKAPTAAQTKQMEAAGKRIGECVTDVMMNLP